MTSETIIGAAILSLSLWAGLYLIFRAVLQVPASVAILGLIALACLYVVLKDRDRGEPGPLPFDDGPPYLTDLPRDWDWWHERDHV